MRSTGAEPAATVYAASPAAVAAILAGLAGGVACATVTVIEIGVDAVTIATGEWAGARAATAAVLLSLRIDAFAVTAATILPGTRLVTPAAMVSIEPGVDALAVAALQIRPGARLKTAAAVKPIGPGVDAVTVAAAQIGPRARLATPPTVNFVIPDIHAAIVAALQLGKKRVAAALKTTAFATLGATKGHLVWVERVSLSDAELPRVIAVTLATNELAVIDLGLIAGPVLRTCAATA